MPIHLQAKQDSHIALTFNIDLTSVDITPILTELAKHNFKAAFFCTGNWIIHNAAQLKQIFEAGHLIGNLSYRHNRFLYLQSSHVITNELAATDEIIWKTIGVKPRFFRPPFGLTSPMLAKTIKRRNYVVMGWSKTGTPTSSIQAGDILYLNAYNNKTLKEILAFLSRSSFHVVRLDELIQERAYAREHSTGLANSI